MAEQRKCECPPLYLQTIPGMLKIAEMVFTILTFSISLGGPWVYHGSAWVEFTGISSFITVTIWLVLHLIKLAPRLTLRILYELIIYCILTIILLISGIITATRASYAVTIGVCSFFAFASSVACGIDAFLLFLEYQKGNHQSSTHVTTVETTTVSVSTVPIIY